MVFDWCYNFRIESRNNQRQKLTSNREPKDLNQAARDFRQRYYGRGNDPGPPPAMAELAPEIMGLIDGVIYGEIYNRPAVNLQTRSLCTIAALTVLGHSPNLIGRHIKGALHIGVTKEQISEIIGQMVFYGGMPAAVNAFRVAKETFDEVDARRADWASGREAARASREHAAEADQSVSYSGAAGNSESNVTPGTGGDNRSQGDEGRVYRDRQHGQSDGGQSRQSGPPSNRPRSAAGGRNQSAGNGRGVGQQSKRGGPGKRSGVHFPPGPQGRGGGGPSRKRNTGGRR